jgi:hypothetical protein
MHSLQYADAVDPLVVLKLAHGQAEDATISYASTLDQPYPLEFWQTSKLCHTAVSQSTAACEVNVANAVARFGQSLNADVGDTGTVTEVNVVEVFAKLSDGKDGLGHV